MFIASNIIFILFGSGYVQKWNNIEEEETPDGKDVISKLITKTESSEVQKSC